MILIKSYVIIIIKKTYCWQLHRIFQKLVLVLAFFIPLTDASEKIRLKKMLYLNYSVQFQTGQRHIKA